ncbi:RlpA-like double-psi beta-barrel-protein domain-containing protein-containing protein [Parasitella parasitica]|nr:RlpA-like double-psi beta-barrel-protein domain-containing protein-containing protein [Parasitella parasitica]
MLVLLVAGQAAPVSSIQARNSMSGDATYYDVGLGSCGDTSSDNEMIAALSSSLMSGSNSDLCGKSITVKHSSGSVTLKIVDSCPGCSEGDVDMSKTAFKKLGKLGQGRIPISWFL